MNASAIFGNDEDTMTLEEKLAAIDSAMAQAVANAKDDAAKNGTVFVQPDPADLTICDGCE